MVLTDIHNYVLFRYILQWKGHSDKACFHRATLNPYLGPRFKMFMNEIQNGIKANDQSLFRTTKYCDLNLYNNI